MLCHQKVNRYHRNADRVSLGMSIRSGYLRKKILGSPQDVLRPERSVGAVLAFDEYGSGFEAFGVVPLASRDTEAHAIGGGGVGRSAGGDETLSQAAVRIEVVLPHRAANQHYRFRGASMPVNRQYGPRLQGVEHTLAAVRCRIAKVEVHSQAGRGLRPCAEVVK